jgi:excisionase family DNA binding protein
MCSRPKVHSVQTTLSPLKTISPKQVAKAIGVSESSLKRWCDQGLIPMSRTEGGHRRLNPADVVAFIRKSERHLAEPEILGLPAGTPQKSKFTEQTIQRLTQALIDGKDEICRRLIFDLYLSNERLGRIFDEMIAKSFHQIGIEWQKGSLDIYQERRAGEICESILIELRSFLPIPNEKSPYAIGATPEGDDYRIANRMAELILRELGWNAISLGTSLPFSTIEKAVIRYEPKLIWLSISSISNKKKFFVAYQKMRERAGDNIAIILGGNALTERVRKEIPCTAYCEHMQDMESHVANIFKN